VREGGKTLNLREMHVIAVAVLTIALAASAGHGVDGSRDAAALGLAAAQGASAAGISPAASAASPLKEPPALRGPVDPDTYIVGPGDGISIALWGRTVLSWRETITPEGDLILSGVAPIPAAGRTLAALKADVEARLGKLYHGMDVSVSLVGLRTMWVNVLGAVAAPGEYSATALDLTSELVGKAGGLLSGGSDRNIVITRRDGSTARADLARYRNTGDIKSNPPVLDGDVIFVPFATLFVHAYGGVARPGRYELTDGETVGSLIALAGGFVRGAVTETVELRTFRDDVKTGARVVDLTGSDGAAVPLVDGDQVYVQQRSEWRVVRFVSAEGELVHPGVYGINEGIDRLSDVLARAGGPTAAASLRNARLVRRQGAADMDAELERLKTMTAGDMTETEYAYFKAKSTELEGTVVADFEGLLVAGASNDPLLRDGDRILVPRAITTVTVSGRVTRPGHVAFAPGKDARYYVARAGGFASQAKRTGTRVVRAATGQRLTAREAGPILPGDEVWVPERPESDWWRTARDIASFAGSLATAYLLINQATK